MGIFDVFRRKSTEVASEATTDGFFSNGLPYDGGKYPGGLKSVFKEIDTLDYWSLRRRSASLFLTNTYARGIVRRFVTNVINTGLSAESTPEESIIGVPEDSLLDWCEDVENRFALYGHTPQIVDIKGQRTLGALQRQIYLEAAVGGDCLVIIRQEPKSKLPQLQIVPGDRVSSPVYDLSKNVIDGVEMDAAGRHVAYHVDLGDSYPTAERYQRIEAYGRKTGRRQAFLVYGLDKREDGVRGEPLLSIAIQPLKEIDNYRDSAQRKAFVNSMITGFIERTSDKPTSLSLQSGGAKRITSSTSTETGGKTVNFAEVLPGVFMERLAVGEKPSPYSTSGTDINFGPFEAAIITGLAWALEMPPEILQLSFEKNYSASQAAINEWKLFLNRERARFGAECCDIIFQDWFLSAILTGKIRARGYLENYNDPTKYDQIRAWTLVDWTGAIKPSVDLVKLANGYKIFTTEGWIDNERAARELTGTKFSKNIRRLKRENELKAEAIKPLLDLQNQYGAEPVAQALALIEGEKVS